jgi:hypothetical protein
MEAGDGTMGAAKIRRDMLVQRVYRLASAEERGPFGSVFESTQQNDLCPSRKESSPLGQIETGASFWQAQRAGSRLREIG